VSDRSDTTQNEFKDLMAKATKDVAALVVANSRKRQATMAKGLETASEVSRAVAPLPPPTSAHRNGVRFTHVLDNEIEGSILRQTGDFLYVLNLDEGYSRGQLEDMGLGEFVIENEDFVTPDDHRFSLSLVEFATLTDVPHHFIDIEVEVESESDEVSVASVCFRN
jgi:hypothetical protein